MSTLSMCMEVSSPRIIPKKRKIKPKGKEIKPPSVLDRIFHRRNQVDTLYYFTHAKSVKPSEARDVLQEPSPFQCPTDRNIFAFNIVQKAWKARVHDVEQHKKYYEKLTSKGRQSADILKRVYVAEKERPITDSGILDLDPEFYSVLAERKRRSDGSVNNYLNSMRNILRMKLIAGFRTDEILLLEQKLQKARRNINDVHDKFKKYMNSFETFLNNDYEESIHLIQRVDLYTKEIMDKNAKIQQLHAENATVEFEVHKLEEHWRDLKMYQKFLYFVSPLSWRQQYDYIHRNKKTNELNTEPSTLFKKYTLDADGNIPPLTQLLDEYLEMEETEEEPRLFFTSPSELQKIFSFIELQNLNCLLHTEEIIVSMENMRKSMDEIEEKFGKENGRIEEIIDKLKKGIEWEEKRANELKSATMKLIDGKFRELVCDDILLKFHVCVEDLYYMCTKTNDAGMNLDEMMRTVEQHYNLLVLSLDSLPQNVVLEAEKLHARKTTYLRNLAKDTAQKIALVDRITWRLKRSLEPPFLKTGKELKWRSAPPVRPPKPKPAPRNLSEEEREYLEFFTTFCQYTDDVKDFGIDLGKPAEFFKAIFDSDNNK